MYIYVLIQYWPYVQNIETILKALGHDMMTFVQMAEQEEITDILR